MQYPFIEPGPGEESVWDYPRPPRLEPFVGSVEVVYCGETIARSHEAMRVLETSHPPVYYIPLKDIKPGALGLVRGQTWCEWKGQASYYDVTVRDRTAKKAA